MNAKYFTAVAERRNDAFENVCVAFWKQSILICFEANLGKKISKVLISYEVQPDSPMKSIFINSVQFIGDQHRAGSLGRLKHVKQHYRVAKERIQ